MVWLNRTVQLHHQNRKATTRNSGKTFLGLQRLDSLRGNWLAFLCSTCIANAITHAEYSIERAGYFGMFFQFGIIEFKFRHLVIIEIANASSTGMLGSSLFLSLFLFIFLVFFVFFSCSSSLSLYLFLHLASSFYHSEFSTSRIQADNTTAMVSSFNKLEKIRLIYRIPGQSVTNWVSIF